ncbi:efflux RND transporter periplasmic adaptor subunit [Hydrogenophaga palleronii]|uniref:efflux RND transporter periplasmic adaptor subunit n=1 Tax=Hydrogenophaga palleronii TaxID=65655 RepID=UPI000A079B11|nr:efflux RND transporter periplasmic adaptor subunit [Hydrogenophaga palleronii]
MPSNIPSADPSPARSSFFTPRLLALLLLVLLIAVAVWYFLLRPAGNTPPAGPGAWSQPVPVLVEATRQGPFTVQVQSIGTVSPYNAVTVRGRVAGQLMRVAVREGDFVEKGQLLAEVDPEPLRVRLAQAQGQQQQNAAQLKHAQSELARYRELFKQDSIARLELERQEALVQQMQGTQQADQAQVDDARLQLSYARITAPISGRVGLRRVDVGNLVAENAADGLFTVLQTRPITVLFTVPEPQVAAVRAAHGAKPAAVAEVWDRDGRQRLATGVLDTLDNQIDAATGTLRLKARFDNTDDALFPNQFVNLRLALQTLPDAMTIPADAVQHGSRGSYVYVIVDGKATVRVLKLGPTSEGRTVVLDGLKAGEAVVLEGLDRLREGRAATIVEGKTAPAAAPAAPAAGA